MHKKNRRMSHHFPFPLPTWKTECGCGGSNLGPLRSGHSPRNGRASGQRSLPLWCHEASILTPWRLGLFMLGLLVQFSSVQLLSRVWLFATLWTTAHQASLSITNSWSLPKLMSIHQVGHAIQPSHPLSSPSSPALNPSHHQGLFKWVSSSHQVAKVLEFQLQHQSFQWTLKTDLLEDGLVGSP